jgi:putative phosphoesterase
LANEIATFTQNSPSLMKIAVLADIHGNFPALQAVADHIERWQPDAIVVAGDIVNRGPRSPECLAFVNQKQQTDGWLAVRGNHEDYVISYASPDSAPDGMMAEIFRVAFHTYQQLDGDVGSLQALPLQVSLKDPAGQEIRVVHASMFNNRTGIFNFTTDRELRDQLNRPRPALFCVGHTHVPFIRQLDNSEIVNVGSVGLPFDGDLRAAYGQFLWQNNRWSSRIIRLDYDRAQAEYDFFETGYLEGAGPMGRLVLDEFRSARSRMYQWMLDYCKPTLKGEIKLKEAVDRFLLETHGLLLR